MKLSLSIIKTELNLPILQDQILYQTLTLTGVQLYTPNLQDDILYIVTPRHIPQLQKSHKARSVILIGDEPCTGETDDIEYLQISGSCSETECLRRIQDIFFQYNRWETRIYEELNGKCRLQTIMDLGSELLRNPIALFDLSMTVICLGGREMIRKDNAVWKNILESNTPPLEILPALKNRNLYQRIITEKAAITYFLPFTGTQCIHANVFVDDKRIGSIDLQDICSPFTQKDSILTEYFTGIISLASYKTSLSKWEHEQQLQVMQKALSGDYCREDETEVLLHFLNWREGDHIKVYCFMSRDYFESNTLDYEQLHIRNNLSPSVVLHIKECIIMLVNERLWHVGSNGKKLPKLMEKLNLYCGISYPFENIALLHYAYQQAQESADFLRRTRQELTVCNFSEIFVRSFFENQTHRKSFYIHPAIHKIREYDRKSGTALLDTFYTYLAGHHTLDQCAEKLFIHTNTLKQRLRKIQELAGDDFYSETDIHLKSLISIMLLKNAY